MSEIIPIVDSGDKIVCYRERGSITKKNIYRISALWLVNSKKEVLLAQRSFNKMHSPGKWGPAVAGTVAKGENYLENIIKETEEEIGIKLGKVNELSYNKTKRDSVQIYQTENDVPYNFFLGPKVFTDTNWSFFCQWYFLFADISLKNFVFPRDEVAQLKWVKIEDFENDLRHHPEKYTSTMNKYYNELNNFLKR